MPDRSVPHDLHDREADRVAKLIEDATDSAANRILIRLGAWTLAVVSLQTAVLIAVLG